MLRKDSSSTRTILLKT